MERLIGRWREEAALQGRDVPVWADISLAVKARVGRQAAVVERIGDQLRARFVGTEALRMGWSKSYESDIYALYLPKERGLTRAYHAQMLGFPCAGTISRELTLRSRPGQFHAQAPARHTVCMLPMDKAPGERVLFFVVSVVEGTDDTRFEFETEVLSARITEIRYFDLGFGVPDPAVEAHDIESGASALSHHFRLLQSGS